MVSAVNQADSYLNLINSQKNLTDVQKSNLTANINALPKGGALLGGGVGLAAGVVKGCADCLCRVDNVKSTLKSSALLKKLAVLVIALTAIGAGIGALFGVVAKYNAKAELEAVEFLSNAQNEKSINNSTRQFLNIS